MNDSTTIDVPNEATDGLHSLQTYVSDLLALEEHIAKPLDAQLDSEAMKKYMQAAAIVRNIKTSNERHATALKECLDSLGGHAASPIKSAWASMLGGAAAAIGSSRKTKVTKWLRDDYTALNLAAMGYTLLQATAIGLGNSSIAGVAKKGLADYARSIMEVSEAVPDLVLCELRDEGVAVEAAAAEQVRRESESVWRDASKSLHGTN
ncbi:MAG: hypothetical protein ABI346_01255 [Candidatus Baltobacteraceae bacterium]